MTDNDIDKLEGDELNAAVRVYAPDAQNPSTDIGEAMRRLLDDGIEFSLTTIADGTIQCSGHKSLSRGPRDQAAAVICRLWLKVKERKG